MQFRLLPFNKADKGSSREHCVVFWYFVEHCNRKKISKQFCYLHLCPQTTVVLLNSNETIVLILSENSSIYWSQIQHWLGVVLHIPYKWRKQNKTKHKTACLNITLCLIIIKKKSRYSLFSNACCFQAKLLWQISCTTYICSVLRVNLHG